MEPSKTVKVDIGDKIMPPRENLINPFNENKKGIKLLNIDSIKPIIKMETFYNCQNSSQNECLDKLRKLLSTLVYFGGEINENVGECVKNLVFSMLANETEVEEFHEKVQEITKCPLKSFVLPFLKINIPHFQNELVNSAKHNNQSVLQYLKHHENILFDSSVRDTSISDIFQKSDAHSLKHLKRKSIQNSADNNNWPEGDTRAKKRFHMAKPLLIEAQQILNESVSTKNEDEWRNIYVMLNCISSMVEKTKRALHILQQRNHDDVFRNEAYWTMELRKISNELMLNTMKAMDTKIHEMEQKFYSSFNEIKQQAISDLQIAFDKEQDKFKKAIDPDFK